MYDAILFPTDGSEGANEALSHALALAETFDATLHVLYVADSNRDSVTVVGNDVVDALEDEGESVVADVVERARTAGVDTVDEVVQGAPHRTIVDYADERDVDVIVMATHGREGLDRYLLGSVTEKVVRTTPVPVLTVRMEE